MLADEIAQFLSQAGLGLNVGSTGTNGIFAIPFPTEAGDTATCVIEYPGRAPVEAMGPVSQVPIYEPLKFQVVSRDKNDNAQACRTLQKNIWNALVHLSATLTGSTGGTATYGYVSPKQSPFFLKYDENARMYYACNYEALRVPTP